ncbi:MAG: hypothetical protein B7C24_16110 [Bacteroidetes bacterium 4572_77]|nr:MAG: hypothetical protein B7C24_16110 [Bacteroidetes bacterium 4572_77]
MLINFRCKYGDFNPSIPEKLYLNRVCCKSLCCIRYEACKAKLYINTMKPKPTNVDDMAQTNNKNAKFIEQPN